MESLRSRIIVFVLGLVGGGLLYYGYTRTTKNAHELLVQKRVALLVPAVHPSMDQIEQGFKEMLSKTFPHASIDVFNAGGNKVLMKGQAEEMIAKQYDCVCAVGTGASQMLKASINKRYINESVILPLFFVAVSDPTRAGLLDDHKMVTGITDGYDYNDQIGLLMEIEKVKKPMIVYDVNASQSFESEIEKIKEAFKKYNVLVDVLPITSVNEVQNKIIGFLDNHDLIMTLTDHVICSAMDVLIKICNQKGITLFTSELDSNYKGAALSYGVNERDYGVQMALQVTEFLQGTHVKDIAIRSISPFYFTVNKTAAPKQQVALPEDQYNLYSKMRINKGK